MNRRTVLHFTAILFVLLIPAHPAHSQTSSTAPAVAGMSAQPLILEKNEGELRTRRIHTDKSSVASSQFLLKVSPKNNGSQHLVLATEELQPNARIPKHKHLVQDEILLLKSDSGL